MIEVDLSIEDFTKYFAQKKLSRLSFPNGTCLIPHGLIFEHADIIDFFVTLDELYKLMCGWRINSTLVPIEDIIAIIAFGSAVRYPGIRKSTHRKYLLFGPKVIKRRTIPIHPEDADFLAITGQDLTRDEVLAPVSLETYDRGTWIEKGGIHLVNRGVKQVLKGVKAADTVSISALREGVPIFFNEHFGDVIKRSGIEKITDRKLRWDENSRGYLFGKIY